MEDVSAGDAFAGLPQFEQNFAPGLSWKLHVEQYTVMDIVQYTNRRSFPQKRKAVLIAQNGSA